MQRDNARCARHTVGRLFSKGGRLHMILEADSASGIAMVSCRVDDTPQVVAMSLTEVMERLGNSTTLKLDGLSSAETEERVFEQDNHWFFRAREGEFGPFPNQQTAKRKLKEHILSAQEEGRTGRPAQATAPSELRH